MASAEGESAFLPAEDAAQERPESAHSQRARDPLYPPRRGNTPQLPVGDVHRERPPTAPSPYLNTSGGGGGTARSLPVRQSSRQSVTSFMSEDTRKLSEARYIRKKADEDLAMMQNRIKRLQLEEERARKNIDMTRSKADDIVRLKAQNELRARAREHAKRLKEEELRREMEAKSLDRIKRDANIRANKHAMIRMKQKMVEQYRHEKVANAQATANMRRKEEERAAKLKQDIYVRERQAVHKKYKGKHLAQMEAVRNYEKRVQEEAQRLEENQRVIQQLEQEESELLNRLRLAQDLQASAYAELEVALEV